MTRIPNLLVTLLAAAGVSACQVGSPTPEGNTSVSQSDFFLLALVTNSAARIGTPGSGSAAFLTGESELRTRLGELPAGQCRQVGRWLSCFGTRAGNATGVALRDDGARCVHGAETGGVGVTQAAGRGAAPTWNAAEGSLRTWSDLGQTCERLA